MRQAFKMKLKKGFEKEYERRHNLLWPEMKQLLHDSGVSDYTIFLDEETGTLFAYQLSATENGSQPELAIRRKQNSPLGSHRPDPGAAKGGQYL